MLRALVRRLDCVQAQAHEDTGRDGRQPQDGQQCRPGDGATVGATVGRAFESVTDRSRRVGDALTRTNKRAERHRQEIRRLRIEQERTGDESGVSRTALGSVVREVVGRRAVRGSGAFQSRPKPRGRSTSKASKSSSHTSSKRSAVREPARASGSWSRQSRYRPAGSGVRPGAAAPPRRPGLRPGRTLRLNGDAGGAALAEAALPFSGGESHACPIATPLRNGAPVGSAARPRLAPSTRDLRGQGLAHLGGRSLDGPRRQPGRPPTNRGGRWTSSVVGSAGSGPAQITLAGRVRLATRRYAPNASNDASNPAAASGSAGTG